MRLVDFNAEPQLQVKLTEEHVDHLDEEADRRGISRSALIRLWLAAGERAEHSIIPSLSDGDSTTEQLHTGDTDPVKQLFYDNLPSDPDDAITLEELKSQMKDTIDERTMELFREVEDIEMEDGGKIYHAQR